MYEIDFSKDNDSVIQNKLFNNIQLCRVDVDIAIAKGKTVDYDTIKAAQALARSIERLREPQV